MPTRVRQSGGDLYLGSNSEWVSKEWAREFRSLTEAVECCVQEDLKDFCFVLDYGKSEIVLNPFDFDEQGLPRSQSAHTARIMLENALLRRERRLLGRAMDAILMRAKERRKQTLPPFKGNA